VLWGNSSSGVGIRGSSSSSFGGSFTSSSAPAVRGESTSGSGLRGRRLKHRFVVADGDSIGAGCTE
jgi:hypothetical protein